MQRKKILASITAVAFAAAITGAASSSAASTQPVASVYTDSTNIDVEAGTDAVVVATPVVAIAAAAGAVAGAFVVGFAVGFVKCLLGGKEAALNYNELELASAEVLLN
jgi:prephenate dehydrogenase